MKINQLLLLAVLSISTFATAQKERKYEKVYYVDQNLESKLYEASITNIVLTADIAKFKLSIENRTSHFLIVDPSKSTFVIGDQTLQPNEKQFILEPFEKKSRTIAVEGKDFNKVKNFSFALDGLSEVIPTSDVFTADPFQLPPAANDFSVADFSVNLKKLSKETQQTAAKFEVVYRGSKIGFVYPSKISVAMPDGNSYANADRKGKELLLFPGDKESFVANWDRMPGGRENDMQLVNMLVSFEGVFQEGDRVAIEGVNAQLLWDEALTEEKR